MAAGFFQGKTAGTTAGTHLGTQITKDEYRIADRDWENTNVDHNRIAAGNIKYLGPNPIVGLYSGRGPKIPECNYIVGVIISCW